MRIELNTFDSHGAISTSFAELTQEQVQALVQSAQEISRLRRAGKPLDAALEGLDEAMVAAQVLEPAPARAQSTVPVTPALVDAFSALRSSVRPSGSVDDTVLVSQQALEAVGFALRAAVAGGDQAAWKWTRVAERAGQDVQSYDLQAVLERMSQAAALGGAPTVREAMQKFPLLFCQSFAELVAQAEQTKVRSDDAMTIVNLNLGNPPVVVSLNAPAGMSENEVRSAVQDAVATAVNYDDIPRRLGALGFEQIEHITVDVPSLPGDDFDFEPGDAETPR